MKLLDIITAPWAILPDNLREIQAIYATHLRGEKIDIAAVEQRLGRSLANEAKAYEVVDGVALLPIDGVMSKRANMFSQISGGVSTAMAARDMRAATADPAVHSIIQIYDTPGGAVDGLQLLIAANDQARAVGKPVVALADGLMASAGYWTGASTDAVYIADLTTQVGSIGVVARHVDRSMAQAQAGEKHTDIVAGRFKRIASENGPLTPEGRQSLQDSVDYFYSVFVADVARFRGVSVDRVLADMADGRVFIGQQAIDAGLVDGVATLDDLIAQLNRDRSSAGAARSARATAATHTATSLKGPAMSLTREALQAQAPDLLQALLAEGQAAGAAAERDRIQAVEAAGLPGHDALINRLKYDGKTSGPEAAHAVVVAERQLRTAAATNLANDAPKPVAPAAAPAVEAGAAAAAQAAEQAEAALPFEDRCKARWERDTKVRAEFTSLEAFTAFSRAEASGRVKRLTKAA